MQNNLFKKVLGTLLVVSGLYYSIKNILWIINKNFHLDFWTVIVLCITISLTILGFKLIFNKKILEVIQVPEIKTPGSNIKNFIPIFFLLVFFASVLMSRADPDAGYIMFLVIPATIIVVLIRIISAIASNSRISIVADLITTTVSAVLIVLMIINLF